MFWMLLLLVALVPVRAECADGDFHRRGPIGVDVEPLKVEWVDVCGTHKDAARYCHCVGKDVADSGTGLRVGKVVGVAWRPKGTLIGTSADRVSPRDAYFYIVKDSLGRLLKDPRDSKFGESTVWCK